MQEGLQGAQTPESQLNFNTRKTHSLGLCPILALLIGKKAKFVVFGKGLNKQHFDMRKREEKKPKRKFNPLLQYSWIKTKLPNW